jgi:PAS domain-containing protein
MLSNIEDCSWGQFQKKVPHQPVDTRMVPSASGTALNLGEYLVSGETVGESRELLSALFKSSTVGVAICDRQFRFPVINEALASMNGIPAAANLGKTLQAVLGSVAAKVQPAFEHVFATGQALSNFALRAELPSTGAVGRWNELFPNQGCCRPGSTGRRHRPGAHKTQRARKRRCSV